MNAFVVLNPVAGNSDPAAIRRALQRHLDSAGWTYDVYETTGEERIAEIVQDRLENFDRFIAAGGDGTVSGVAGGLVETDIPMGILPMGTGNGVARDLGIPLDLEEALTVITKSHTHAPIDAMQIGEQFFVLNVGIGMSATTMRDTEPQEKQRFGRLAYVWTGLAKYVGIQPHGFHLHIDGQDRRLRASEIIILNGSGPGKPLLHWRPQVHLGDGQLGAYIVHARTLLDYVRVMWSMITGEQRAIPHVQFQAVEKEIQVNASHSLPVQADGEVIGQTPVRVRLVPQAVRVIVPDNQDNSEDAI